MRAQDISFHMTSHRLKCVCYAIQFKRIFKMHTNQPIKEIIAEKPMLIQCQTAEKNSTKQINSWSLFFAIIYAVISFREKKKKD